VRIQVCREHISSRHDDIIVAGIFEKSRSLTGAAGEINACTGGMIQKIVRRGDFTGRLYQVMPLYPGRELRAQRVLLVGLGKEKDFTLERLRGACAGAARYVRAMGLKSFTLLGVSVDRNEFDPLQTLSNHAVYRITATTTNTYYLDSCE